MVHQHNPQDTITVPIPILNLHLFDTSFWRFYSESDRDLEGCNLPHYHYAIESNLFEIAGLGFEPRSSAYETNEVTVSPSRSKCL